MRLVIFTAVVGLETDTLRPPETEDTGLDLRCFTDQAIEVDRWKMIPITPAGDPRAQARMFKILAHQSAPDADASIWVDASFQIIADLAAVAREWLGRAPIVAFRHPHRDTIVEEGDEVVRLGLAPRDLIDRQIERHRERGFDPDRQALITSSGFCLRLHSPEVERFNQIWWDEFSAAGHYRDQMSIDFALWRAGLRAAHFKGHYRENPHVNFRPTRGPAGRHL